jgi:predicted  nucleic acid-binding Zn-ribbon protein
MELRTEKTQNKDAYLRREIEWLVLDKQRAELTRAIKEAEKNIDDAKS